MNTLGITESPKKWNELKNLFSMYTEKYSRIDTFKLLARVWVVVWQAIITAGNHWDFWRVSRIRTITFSLQLSFVDSNLLSNVFNTECVFVYLTEICECQGRVYMCFLWNPFNMNINDEDGRISLGGECKSSFLNLCLSFREMWVPRKGLYVFLVKSFQYD